MKKLFYTLSLIFFLYSCFSSNNNDSFSGTYLGYWAETQWMFKFYNDNTFKRISEGHFGDTKVTGNYKINSDTIEIFPRHEKSYGSINRFYIIDGDSCIIDIDLRYDYCKLEVLPKEIIDFDGEKLEVLGGSRTRNIKYPQTPVIDTNQVTQLENAMNTILHLDTLQNNLACLGDSLFIANYFEMTGEKTYINWKGQPLRFKNKEELENKNFVEIEDINITDSYAHLSIKIRCNKKGKIVSVYFSIVNKKWEIDDFSISPIY